MRHHRRKIFGTIGHPLDREAKCRLMHLARCLTRRTTPGKHYGVITAKALEVFSTLLWQFHNARTGLCIPAYDTIARLACCSRSTVATALQSLHAAGLIDWVHRLKRIREYDSSALAWRWRVLRSSNAYVFRQAKAAPIVPAKPSESKFQSVTTDQDSNSSLELALSALGRAFERSIRIPIGYPATNLTLTSSIISTR
jgi:hypothetical protein